MTYNSFELFYDDFNKLSLESYDILNSPELSCVIILYKIYTVLKL